MYTHRQAAWRSAWAVAVAVLPFLVTYSWQALRPEAASPVLPFVAALAMIGILSVVLAAAFGAGFRLSALKTVGIRVILVTAMSYLVPLVLLFSIPIETHAVLMDLPPTPEQAQRAFVMNVLVPFSAAILVLFAFPLGVAFAVARLSRAGANAT
jgi:hypothetical protein